MSCPFGARLSSAVVSALSSVGGIGVHLASSSWVMEGRFGFACFWSGLGSENPFDDGVTMVLRCGLLLRSRCRTKWAHLPSLVLPVKA